MYGVLIYQAAIGCGWKPEIISESSFNSEEKSVRTRLLIGALLALQVFPVIAADLDVFWTYAAPGRTSLELRGAREPAGTEFCVYSSEFQSGRPDRAMVFDPMRPDACALLSQGRAKVSIETPRRNQLWPIVLSFGFGTGFRSITVHYLFVEPDGTTRLATRNEAFQKR